MSEDGLPPWPWYGYGQPQGDIIKRATDAYVGAWVLIHDINCRVYRKSHSVGGHGPVDRYYYRPAQIIGENRSSWVLSGGEKTSPKKPSETRRARFYGLDDVEDALWRSKHRHGISRQIERLEDVALMRRVAELIGYDAQKAP